MEATYREASTDSSGGDGEWNYPHGDSILS